MLNDFKDTDFIGIVTVTSKSIHEFNKEVDVIKFSTQEIIKGEAIDEVMVFQKKGNGKNNDGCLLYLHVGDQLLLYANQKGDYHYTMPCYRNRLLTNDEKDYQISVQNQIKILRQLKPHAEVINASTTKCRNVITDRDVATTVEKIPLDFQKARLGLYSVKFTTDQKIDRIEVISSFDKRVDKEVRIALIKKKWTPCKLKENGKLVLGYFYTPSTRYRKAHLSPL